jgi:ketosteroid isomerase-like protein
VTITDYESIRRLCAEYCHYLDGSGEQQDLELLLDLFDDAGALFSPRQSQLYQGRDELRGFFAGVHTNSKGLSKHLTTNVVITVDDDTATAVSDWIYVRPESREGTDVLGLASYGRFHDEYVRAEGRWKIRSRTISRGNEAPSRSTST